MPTARQGAAASFGRMSEEAVPAPPERVKNPTEVLFVLLLAGISFALSQTLVIPALPEIGERPRTRARRRRRGS